MRDLTNGEMREVSPRRWELFEALPTGVSPLGDSDVLVRVINGNEDLAALEADNARFAAEDKIIEAHRLDRRKALDAEMAARIAKREEARKVERGELPEHAKAMESAAEKARQERIAKKQADKGLMLEKRAAARKKSAEILAAQAAAKAKAVEPEPKPDPEPEVQPVKPEPMEDLTIEEPAVESEKKKKKGGKGKG